MSVGMKRPVIVGAVVLGVIACGSGNPSIETTGVSSSAIQAGTNDSTHLFAVGVVQLALAGQVAFCSGVMLGPNLVATARHCVAQLPSQAIDCSSSTFGPLYPLTDLFVTTDATITMNSHFIGTANIVVPPGSAVCGNDLALVILDRNIQLSSYAVPAINPSITDQAVYSTNVAAIGYGVDTPTDDAGVTAGTRRIKQNVGLNCIPNDRTFADCFADPRNMQVLTANEFVSGDSTCEGDSGSGVYDQRAFNQGSWLGFGVLSRGAVSPDGLTCIQPIYTRFDAFAQLLQSTAKQAASMGGYAAPGWANGATTEGGGDAGMGTPPTGSSGSSGSSSGASGSGGTPAGALADGTMCSIDTDCQSKNCVSTDNMSFFCASPCGANSSCASNFGCTSGYCFASAAAPSTSSHGGCAAAPGDTRSPWSGGALGGSGLGLAALVGMRRRRRR
jgi:hypothetical protein